MLGDEKKLVSGDSAHGSGVPAAQGGATAVAAHSPGDVSAADSVGHATQAEIYVFEIGFKAFVQEADFQE